MPKAFHVTYDIVSPTSATSGAILEAGFVSPGEWHDDMSAAPCGPAFLPIKAEHALSLREAIGLIGLVSDGDGSFYEVDERQDYRTGFVETRALHCPDTITVASLGRVRRLLASNNLLAD